MRRTRLPFEDSIDHVQDAVVLLDIDATLVPDGVMDVSDAVRQAVAHLKARNEVYLITNGKDKDRVTRLALELSLSVGPVGVPAGKPFARAASGIGRDRPLVVIGDKLLVDGIFACVIGASFIQVRSKH